jgi:predicted RecB family endonuclease
MKIFSNTNTDVAPIEVEEPIVEPTVDEASLVPLVLLVPELRELGIASIEDLDRYLGDDVVRVAGGLVRCTTRERAAQLAEELERVRAQWAEIAARNAEKARLAAAKAHAAIPAGAASVPGLDAALSMKVGAGEGPSSRRHDDFMDSMLRGVSEGYTFGGISDDEGGE